MITKRCPACGETKPLDEFYRHRGQAHGRTCYCKMCFRRKQQENYSPEQRRKWNRASWLRRYGMTSEEYDAMLEQQGGCCAICREACASGMLLAVDHDHETGRVRGLLCRRCNQAIGQFGDRIDLLYAAAEYLSNVGSMV